MAHFYHITVQKPTSVVASCTGSFTDPHELNLVIAKNTCIEVYNVDGNGLKLVKDIPINGSIVVAKLFRLQNASTDSLFILLATAQVAIINCTKKQQDYEFFTVACGSIEDKGARSLDKSVDALIDPCSTYIVIRFYHGLLKVISLENLGSKISSDDAFDSSYSNVNNFTVRIIETNVIDMTFLHGYNFPTFAMIYIEDLVVHMKTYEIYGREPVLRNIHPTLNSIETDSKLLIPVDKPYYGVIIASDKMVVYQSKDGPHVAQYIPLSQPCQVVCYTKIDNSRYLIGDMAGRLYMLQLLHEESAGTSFNQSTCRINSINVELLGEVVVPETICYLGNSIVFVGSAFGDSQLIRLKSELDIERNSYIAILDQFTNIGSIVDLCLFENKEQSQLITCSGAFKEGSLRVILNGIGIQERASIEQDLIRSVWCFSIEDTEHDDSILISFVNSSQLLRLVDDNICAGNLDGLRVDDQTLYLSKIFHLSADSKTPFNTETIIQVSVNEVSLIGVLSKISVGLICKWSPPNGKHISCASSHLNIISVASARDLYTLQVTQTASGFDLEQIAHRQLSNEVACLDLSPFDSKKSPTNDCDFGGDGFMQEQCKPSEYVAVGLWLGHGIIILSLPDLNPIYEMKISETTQNSGGSILLPRSILISQLEEQPHIFIAMGDGTLFYYSIKSDPENPTSLTLTDAKRVNVGSGPSIYLRQWRSLANKNNVFVCSNRPCVLYSSKQKLVFANVNLQEVSHVASLNGKFYSNCLCLVTPTGLVIGSVDEIKKLHIRTIPLEETPRRLALQVETNSLAVISYRQEIHHTGIGFRPLRSSISLNTKVPRTTSQLPKTAPPSGPYSENKQCIIDVSSMLIFDKTSLELQATHTFYYHQNLFEHATSIASMKIKSKSATPDPMDTLALADKSSTSIEGDVYVYVVGTAFIVDWEREPSRGRIHVFRWDEEASRLTTLLVYDVAGAPYRLVDFNGKLLAAINSSVRLFEISLQTNTLKFLCSHNENITVLSLKCKNDFVLTGDIMKSLTLLLHRPNVQSFDVIGMNRDSRWLTSCEILDDDHFIGSETNQNLFVVTRESTDMNHHNIVAYSGLPNSGLLEPRIRALFVGPSGSSHPKAIVGTNIQSSNINDLESIAPASQSITNSLPSTDIPTRNTLPENRRLIDCAFMHVGDLVNCIVRGSMVHPGSVTPSARGTGTVIQCNGEQWPAINPESFIYATVKGALGQLFQISPILFAFLREVESRLEKLIVPVGGFAHDQFRASREANLVKMAQNFVDGDLVELLLDLSIEEKQFICDGLYCPISLISFGTAGSTTYSEPEVKPCTVEDLTQIIEEMTRLH